MPKSHEREWPKEKYNQSMKSTLAFLNHFVFSLSLILSSQVVTSIAVAQTDTSLDAQRAECAKNSAAEWNASLNRCVGKAQARADRHEVEDCGAILDVEQRKECHKRIAEKKTGLNSDPNSLPEGSGSAGNMAMINAAYAILGFINGMGKNEKESSCTSKKIFGITSMAGVATDIWLKIKAKEALDDLKNKYTIDVKNSAYDAQSKAFQYLREEQQVVKDIASREKKRNMLLMVGYGAASVMAIVDMYEENPECYKKATNENDEQKDKKKEETPPEKKADATPKETTKCDAGMTPGENGTCIGTVAPQGKIEEHELPPDNKPEPQTVSVQSDPQEVAPSAAPKDQFVAEQRNGVTQIRSTDGSRAIVGDRIIDNRTGAVVGRVDSSVEITRVGTSAPIAPSDYRRYGVYSSSATNNASTINFINSSSSGRTTVNGSATTINDARLRGGR